MREPGEDDDKPQSITIASLIAAYSLSGSRRADPAAAARLDQFLARFGPGGFVEAAGFDRAKDRDVSIAKTQAMMDQLVTLIEMQRGELADAIDAGEDRIAIGERLEFLTAAHARVERTHDALVAMQPADLAPAAALLGFVGGVRRPCKQCGRGIWVVTLAHSLRDAFDGTGARHASTCAGQRGEP
jgi:hypothetical protein